MNRNGTCLFRAVGKGISVPLAVLFIFVPLTAMHGAESKTPTTTNMEQTTLDVGDPLNAGTGEFHFHRQFMNLGGPFPVSFSFFYGSQLNSKLSLDGLPERFAGSHRGSVKRVEAADPPELFVDTGLGREIGFIDKGYGWSLFNMEGPQYTVKETPDYYYFQDPMKELVYTFGKKAIPLEYRTYERISVSTQNAEGKYRSGSPNISDDGRYVVFDTVSVLDEGDTNSNSDVYLRDRLTKETFWLSSEPGGVAPEGRSSEAAISGDGRYVVFTSYAKNLTDMPITDGHSHIYLHDLNTGTNVLVDIGFDDAPGNANFGSNPAVSADGRYVTFKSAASNLVANDTNGKNDVFVRDMKEGQTIRVSLGTNGIQGDGNSYQPAISADGDAVAFTSVATNLVPDDTNGVHDVFLWRRETNKVSRISVSSNGEQGDKISNGFNPAAISADGRYVVFESEATNLVSDDTNGRYDIFLRDTKEGVTTRVSLSVTGGQLAEASMSPDISGDGNVVAYRVGNDCKIYRNDLRNSQISLVANAWDGTAANNQSYTPKLTYDGGQVVFESEATNLMAGDTNGVEDIFAARFTSADKGFLTRVEDRNGNALTYETADEANLEKRGPDRIYDDKGRELKFTYAVVGTTDTNPYLTKVEDQTGRAYTFAYQEGPTDNAGKVTLRSITDPLGNITTYTYAGANLIAEIKKPMGNTPYKQTYETINGGGVVKTQTDAYGNVTTISRIQYPADTATKETKFTVTYPDSTSETYVHGHDGRVVSSLTDAAGRTATFSSDATRDRLTGVTDRTGNATTLVYHAASGKIAETNSAESKKTVASFTAVSQTFTNPINNEQVTFTFYDRTGIDYPDGTSEQFTFNGSGNVLSHVDKTGKIWTYTYNSQGLPLTITNPAGGVTTYTYDVNGTMAASKDSDTGTTQYTVDALGHLIKITRPDNSARSFVYNANDQITSVANAAGKVRQFEYDQNGNLIKITGPDSQTVQYTYNLMDRPTTTTNRRGKSETYSYDQRFRLSSVTDPNNIITTFGYDQTGRLNKSTIGSSSWTMAYDNEGILVASQDPKGNITTLDTDKIGRVTAITDSAAQRTEIVRDTMGRVTKVVDRLGRITTRDYDANGALTGVAKPEIGTAVYKRNYLGLLEEITDLNGKKWTLTYSGMGRQTRRQDPLGNILTQSYDNFGRLSLKTFADGVTVAYAYDATGNVTKKTYSNGLVLNYAYDADSGRMISSDKIAFTYDASGNFTSTLNQQNEPFNVTYDAGGRLATVTYNGALTVTYTYDGATGLLAKVEDDLTGSDIAFTYDAAFRPIGIARSNSVNTTYAYDALNRVVRIQDGALGDIKYTLDAEGQMTQVDSTLPLVAGSSAAPLRTEKRDFTYDDACQVSTAGYTYDKRGRRTAGSGHTYNWDAAGRLTGIDSVSLAYNGLNSLISRTEGSNTTYYYYNFAVWMKPIVAEKKNSTWSRYYVHTPEGKLLYMIDAVSNQVYFYHFDYVGSTTFLTDKNGAVTDSYAYVPDGRLLKHDGQNDQPFTFVGQWGVRAEGANDLYQMRARYYDAVTRQFLSRDPAWPLPSSPLTLNPYQYANNNPASFIDPMGTDSKKPTKWDRLCSAHQYYQRDNAKKEAEVKSHLEAMNAAKMGMDYYYGNWPLQDIERDIKLTKGEIESALVRKDKEALAKLAEKLTGLETSRREMMAGFEESAKEHRQKMDAAQNNSFWEEDLQDDLATIRELLGGEEGFHQKEEEYVNLMMKFLSPETPAVEKMLIAMEISAVAEYLKIGQEYFEEGPAMQKLYEIDPQSIPASNKSYDEGSIFK